jgi:hypothetical protein
VDLDSAAEMVSAEMVLRHWLLTYSYGIYYRKNRLMSRTIMSRPRRPQRPTIPDRYSQRFRELKREFQQLEYFCKGTLLKRMMKCGKAQCACRQDPAKRHGPYFEWTYKAKGKTVNVKLTPEVMPLFRAASQQYRKLKSLLNRLETLSQTVLRHQAKRAQSAHRD